MYRRKNKSMIQDKTEMPTMFTGILLSNEILHEWDSMTRSLNTESIIRYRYCNVRLINCWMISMKGFRISSRRWNGDNIQNKINGLKTKDKLLDPYKYKNIIIVKKSISKWIGIWLAGKPLKKMNHLLSRKHMERFPQIIKPDRVTVSS